MDQKESDGSQHDDPENTIELNMRFIEKMNTLGVRHVAHITEGDHSWPIWHGYLREFASQVFQEATP